MNPEINQKVIVSLFQIPEDYRAALAKIASESNILKKQSINDCILHALDFYLNLPQGTQTQPLLPKLPLRAFTVRSSKALKEKISHCAAIWQLKTSMPISMNAVVNTAILVYLQNHIQGYSQPF